MGTKAVGLVVVALAATVFAGCGSGVDDAAPAAVSSTLQPAPQRSAATTTPSDDDGRRERTRPVEWFECRLGRAIEASSHLLRVTAGEPRVEDVAPLYPTVDDSHAMGPPDPVFVDVAEVTIEDVVTVRPRDPRREHFDDRGVGDTLLVSTLAEGSVLPDIADRSTLIAVGQQRLDTIQEWQLNLALSETADGPLSFLGPCGSEFDRQLAALSAAFDSSPDVAFLGRMIDEALMRGRTVDLEYITADPDRRGVGFESVPPSLVGSLRVLGVFVTVKGLTPVTLGFRSSVGSSALASAQAGGGAGFLLPGVLGVDGPAEYVVMTDEMAPGQVLVSWTADDLRGVDAVHVHVDLTTMTATWEPLDRAALAAMSKYPVETLDSLQARYQALLDTPATTKARVEVIEFEPFPVTS